MKFNGEIWWLYSIEHKDSGRKYIGKTIDLKKRFYEHLRIANNSKRKYYIHNAINYYGSNAFWFKAIGFYFSEKEILEAEIKTIAFFKSNQKQFGFNLTMGGEGVVGFKFSEENKLKMSNAHKIFNEEQVNNILKDYESGNFTMIKLGNKYNCSSATIVNLLSGKFYNVSSTNLTNIKKKNKSMSGQNNPNAKFSNEQILDILNKHSSGNFTIIKLSKDYNCSRSTIEKIINRKTYRNINFIKSK